MANTSTTTERSDGMYAVAKWNADLNCPTYLSTNGVSFTAHPDKAQRFDSLDAAVRWHRVNPGTHVRPFPTGYELV